VITFSEAGNLVFLHPVLLSVFLLLCGYVIISGRPEWALGIQLAILGWTRNIMVGPVSQTYLLLLTAILATVVRLMRTPSNEVRLLPEHDRGIVIWMLLWWAWMFLLLELFDARRVGIYRSDMLNNVVVTLPLMLPFVSDLRRVKHFAVAFIASSLFGGYLALLFLEVPLASVLSDPALNSFGINHLEIANYHRFAWNFGPAIILAIVLFMQARNSLFSLLLLLSAGVSGYFILLSGSRQSIAGTLIGLMLFGLWALFNPRVSRVRMLMILIAVLAISLPIYRQAPHLVIRSGESNLADAFDITERSEFWQIGWQSFAESPIWGSGFEVEYAHNLFFGTMGQQGFVGLVFLLGYLYFIARQSRVIVNGRGSEAGAPWRVACLCIVVFGLVHGMASGTMLNMRHLYWAPAILWGQSALVHPASIPTIAYATQLLPRMRTTSYDLR
jgi:O-antigen ligase